MNDCWLGKRVKISMAIVDRLGVGLEGTVTADLDEIECGRPGGAFAVLFDEAIVPSQPWTQFWTMCQEHKKFFERIETDER